MDTLTLTAPTVTASTRRMVIMFAVTEGPGATEQALLGGIPGYLLQSEDPETLMAAIRDITKEGSTFPNDIARKVMLHVTENDARPANMGLSPRETDVLKAMVDGLSYKMIADKLCISFETVRSHVKRIYEKLSVHNNTEAVAKALKGRLVA